MKLLNILARELKVWPESWGLFCVATKVDGNDAAWFNCRNPVFKDGGWQDLGSVELWLSQEPDDRKEVVVRRFEWQAAVDTLKAGGSGELKWPDGSTHFQDIIAGATRPVFWNVVDGIALKAWRMMPDKVTVEETYTYCSKGCPTFNISKCIERPAPKVFEWEQGDIPNAGDQCEAYVLAETEKQGRPMNRWIPGKFIGKALADNGGITLLVECDDGWTHVINAFSYVRPVRTPEQVAAEERESGIQAIQDAYTYTVGPSTHKILHSQATRLYDAGCRLQVAP